jgi:hypothetical protein
MRRFPPIGTLAANFTQGPRHIPNKAAIESLYQWRKTGETLFEG